MTKKLILFIVIVAVAAAVAIFLLLRKFPENKPENTTPSSANENIAAAVPEFSQQIFDPAQVSHITPLGELSGGGEEYQAVSGVMVNIKEDFIAGGGQMDVAAPTDLKLVSVYPPNPEFGGTDWGLEFEISPGWHLILHHLSKLAAKTEEAAATADPEAPGFKQLPQPVDYQAGEVFATTTGTEQAHNWNIYLLDQNHENNFINTERFQAVSGGQQLLNAVCVFDYFPDSQKQPYMDLLGFSVPGQSKTCGTVSHDQAGTLAGMWFVEKTDIKATQDGTYTSPLSIYKNSADLVDIANVNNIEYRLENAKDPATVSDQHCYNLISTWDGSLEGYAFFKLISEDEIQLAYGSGACPAGFPEGQGKTYYR